MTSIGSTFPPTATTTSAIAGGGPADGTSDAKAKRDADRLQQAKTAVENLKRRTDDARAERKALAKRKLDALKEQLRQMQMYGASPRQIAQLAKELAAAVKSYASAGGSDGGAPAAPGQPASAPGATVSPEAAAAGEEADPAQTEATPGVTASDVDAEEAPADEAKAPDEDAAKSPYEKTLQAQEEDARRQARMSAEANEDREFLAKARSLAKALKNAADRAAAKAKGPEAAEAKDADKAAREAIRAVDDAERDLSDTASPLSMVFMTV